MWQPALFLMQNEKFIWKLLKEQGEIVRAREHTMDKIHKYIVVCLVFVDLLILTDFDFFFILTFQELYYYCLHWGPST